MNDVLNVDPTNFYALYYFANNYYFTEEFSTALDYVDDLIALNLQTDTITSEKQFDLFNLLKVKMLFNNPSLDYGKLFENLLFVSFGL